MTNLRLQEALANFHRYLADAVPPLQAAESLLFLLEQPVDLVAAEINAWVAAQYSGKGTEAQVSDYLFHALKKIHAMGELQLLPAAPLDSYLGSLKGRILGRCPEEERGFLQQKLGALGKTRTALDAAVAYIHRPVDDQQDGPSTQAQPSDPSGSTPFPFRDAAPVDLAGDESHRDEEDIGKLGSMVARHDRILSLLLQRLSDDLPESAPETAAQSEVRNELVPQVIAAAARNAQSGVEFSQFQEMLRQRGIRSDPDQAFRTLAEGVPDWFPLPCGGEENESPPASLNSLLEAMGRIVKFAESRKECTKRFRGLVSAAVEQFNQGALARSVSMFDLSEKLAEEGGIDPSAVENLRGSGQELLDPDRLRAFAENPKDHPLLCRALEFFLDLRPESLLEKLKVETQRSRRRLLLSLIEVHGEPARKEALGQLELLFSTRGSLENWYFIRNLVYILSRIPRRDDERVEEEIRAVSRLLDPGHPAPLVKEAIADLGHLKHQEAENVLVAQVWELENLLLGVKPSPYNPEKLDSILDRLVFALARFGTPGACRAVCNHGLKKQSELGDTNARLAYLAGQDLSSDEKTLNRLLGALEAALPRKVLGLVLSKDAGEAMNLIKVVSSSSVPAVRRVLEQIARRFPDLPLGAAAAAAIVEFDARADSSESASGKLMGDLALFGLPDLLRQLVRAEVTGTLTLTDKSGRTTATFSLEKGKMRSCRVAQLEGEDAVYHLFEKPASGTFAFAGRRPGEGAGAGGKEQLRELDALISEGMRRFDDYRRFCALIPGRMPLKITGSKPDPPGEEDDVFWHALWEKASQGLTAEECEKNLPRDPLAVRSLLAHWVEEGRLSMRS